MDFSTENLTVKASERFSFGYTDWRVIFGNGSTHYRRVPPPTPAWYALYEQELSILEGRRWVVGL